MKSPVYGYSNILATQQTPKADRREPKQGGTVAMTTSSNSVYRWNSALREHGGVGDDSGTISKRPAWRCVDCGAEREPTSDSWECCSRCGSTTEPRWCNGQAGSECDRIEAKASMPTTEKRADARRDQGTCSGNQSGVERCGRGEAESAGSAG